MHVKINSHLVKTEDNGQTQWLVSLGVQDRHASFDFWQGSFYSTQEPELESVLESLSMDCNLYKEINNLDDLASELDWQYNKRGDLTKLEETYASLKRNYALCARLFGIDFEGWVQFPLPAANED